MTGRERVLQALAFGEADRIPIDFWAVGEVYERLRQAWDVTSNDAVLDRVGVDLRYFRGPGFDAARARRDPDGSFADHWGVRRRPETVTGQRRDGSTWTWTYNHMVSSPLAQATSVAEVDAHAWPDPDAWDYTGVRAACEAIRDAGHAVVFGGDRLDRTSQLKCGMYLRGMERFVADLLLEPAIVECILEHVADYYLRYNRRVFEAAGGAIDIFFMGDDMGTQDSTWVSPDMYRRLFKERFAQFNALAHAFGARTMYHTCGRVTPLVGEFVDAGLDVLQSLQPAAMGHELAELKRRFGRHLAFQGGVDIQGVLPRGSTADVHAHVRELAQTMGPGGGYIFGTAHNLLPDTPTENILALVQAYHEYGQYA